MSNGSAHSPGKKHGPVIWLVPRDRLPRDDEQRQRMTELRGDAAVALSLSEAREELAYRLATVSLAATACDLAEVKTCARRLRRIGTEVGFPTLTNAADNVLNCLDSFDAAALGATVARLHRLGVMALRDLSNP